MDKNKLKNIKAVVFDADGVLFTGRVFVHKESGEMLKERSHVDGQGISLLRNMGIKIAFVTGEKSEFLIKVCDKLNSLPSVINGKWDRVGCFLDAQGEEKVKLVDKWLSENKILWEECATMGDDLADYQMLKKSAFTAAPAQAEKIIKDIVDYVAKREGGNGAIRDFCNLILEAKGINHINSFLR
jgi:3-deoxy-D-manno-octulosonate 8-phosphate phosphatase (KDO 8-P phosphatase)